MAFRTGQTLGEVFAEARQTAARLRADAMSIKAQSAAGSLSGGNLLGYVTRLIAGIARLQTLAATSGLAAYAQAQYDDPEYDVAAEFVEMLASAATVRDWIVANYPTVDGYLQREQLSAAGVTDRVFTAAQTADLRDQLDGLIAAIG